MATVTLTGSSSLSGYIWGIPTADETSINIETLTIKATGQKKLVPNRLSAIIGRVDFQFIKTYSIKGFITGTTGANAAAIGLIMSVANDIALGSVPAGYPTLLDDVQVDRMAADLSRISYNLTAYAGMPSATQSPHVKWPTDFGFPFFDAAQPGKPMPPLVPVMPSTNEVSLFPPEGTPQQPDAQGVPPDYVPLKNSPQVSTSMTDGTPLESIGSGTPLQSFGLGSSV